MTDVAELQKQVDDAKLATDRERAKAKDAIRRMKKKLEASRAETRRAWASRDISERLLNEALASAERLRTLNETLRSNRANLDSAEISNALEAFRSLTEVHEAAKESAGGVLPEDIDHLFTAKLAKLRWSMTEQMREAVEQAQLKRALIAAAREVMESKSRSGGKRQG